MVSSAAALHVALWVLGSLSFLVGLALLVGRIESYMNEDSDAGRRAAAARAGRSGGGGGGVAHGGARAPGGAVRRRPGDTQA
jgi:hypothetical protein